MGVIPISGFGIFNVDIDDLTIFAHTFLAWNQDVQVLLMKNLHVEVTYSDIHFNFPNLMGGGTIGQTLNLIINTLGDAVIDRQKSLIHSKMSEVFHEIMSNLL